MSLWDKLFTEKCKEVLNSKHEKYISASLSPRASGYCAREQIAEEYYAQADRIAELEKQGEPVAWMEYIQDEEWEVWYTEPTDLPEGHSYKPLYLAPQSKPLNDEEIYALWCEADNTELLPEMRLNDGSINYIITTFVKLIEERHGIK